MNTEKKTILLTGGRAPATLELARLFDQAGHRVVVAESLPAHLCRVSRAVARSYRVRPPRLQENEYIEELCRIAEREKADLLIPTCEEVFFVAKGRERLRHHVEVLVESLEELRIWHDKGAFVRLAEQAGFSVPRTSAASSARELREALHAVEPGKSVVLKPAFSRFSARVHILRRTLSKKDWFLPYELPSIKEGETWLVQEYVEGRQLCSYAVAREGRLSLYADYATTFTAGRGASISFSFANHPGVRRFVETMVRLRRFTGQIAFDFIETQAGELYPIECNPRLTSGIHLFRGKKEAADAFFAGGKAGGEHAERENDGEQDKCIEAKPVLVPSGSAAAALSMAMLVYGLPSIRSWREGKRWLGEFFRSRDVVFRWGDPLPALEQLRLLWTLAALKRKTGMSMVECSTSDIEWNGEG
ncbi:ATP-grasp domain-containing protein [Brevibacillus borstelensis]|uniref:ATP-grasp domain-containing protein n=1 Tax=Brevibacillus borstelensis TaxID=45462 RepID=UPI0030BAC816